MRRRSYQYLYSNIVPAFRGMHVSPAKRSYAWLPRKCDYRTDRQTPDKVIPMCRFALQATQKSRTAVQNQVYKIPFYEYFTYYIHTCIFLNEWTIRPSHSQCYLTLIRVFKVALAVSFIPLICGYFCFVRYQTSQNFQSWSNQ